jgi:hypothetical protein
MSLGLKGMSYVQQLHSELPMYMITGQAIFNQEQQNT